MPAVLLERQPSFDELDRLLSAVSRRTCASAVLFIEGGWGLGKTTIVNEFLRLARRRRFRVADPLNGRDLATCLETHLPVPAPVLADQVAPDRVSAPAPGVVVAVDDADIADRKELRRFMYAYRPSTSPPVIWLLSAGCGDLVGHVAADDVRHHKLATLTEKGVTALTTALLGAPPGAGLRALTQQVGGNPLLLRELIEGLREEGGVTPTSDGRMQLVRRTLPERVTATVKRRLGSVSASCQHLLQVAAVASAPCPLVIADLMHTTPASVLPLLTEATRADLLAPTFCAISFTSPLVRRVVRESLPAVLANAVGQQAVAVAEGRCTCLGPAERLSGAVTVPGAVPARRGEAWEVLTQTEQQIAELAAEGLTNQQIARQVFLSPHTVNYHLRRIFRKLGITSRVELVKILYWPDARARVRCGDDSTEGCGDPRTDTVAPPPAIHRDAVGLAVRVGAAGRSRHRSVPPTSRPRACGTGPVRPGGE